MKGKSEIINVFTGTEIAVIKLRGELEDAGILSMIRNDFKQGIDAGFVSGVQSAIDLYILESDLEKARPLIIEFTKRNK